MKTIVAGSREGISYKQVQKAIEDCPWPITEIVSGGSRGVDTYAIKIAEKLGYEVKIFPAKWDEYGKGAGYIRNDQMADYASALIAVWDGQSRGTKHMLDTAKRKGLRTEVIIIRPQEE